MPEGGVPQTKDQNTAAKSVVPHNNPQPISDRELTALVSNEITGSVGYKLNDGVSLDQYEAMKRYFGLPYGDETKGRSSIVIRTVMDTIEQCMPSLMRVFADNPELARFEPVVPSPEGFQSYEQFKAEVDRRADAAKQATDYCNYVFWEDNGGFVLLYDWFKDALLQKNGVVKMFWDESEEVRFQEFKDLNEDQLAKIMQDLPGAEIVEQETSEEEVIKTAVDPRTGQPVQVQMLETTYPYIKLKLRRKIGKICIIGVPPEEFLISRQARGLKNLSTNFIAHRALKSKSEMISMGFDENVVNALPANNTRLSSMNEDQRGRFIGETDVSRADNKGQNATIELFECYVRADRDGDGVSELLKIYYVQNQILDVEEVDRAPFYAISPIRIPHRFHGLSYADLSVDLQQWNTVLVRQMNDNLYATNAPELAIGRGVNIDDALNRKVRGVIRCDDVSQLKAISIPFTAGESFPMVKYIEEQTRRRTGVASDLSALKPEDLKRVTTDAFSELKSMSESRPELVARLFAETGIKELFKGMLELLREKQDYTRVIPLRGNFVPVNPQDWDVDTTVATRIGMGYTGQAQRKSAFSQVFALQEKIASQAGGGNGMVTPETVHAAIADFMPLIGVDNYTKYFNMPVPPDPDEPSPEEKAMEAQIAKEERIEKLRLQSKERVKMAELRVDAKLEAAKIILEEKEAKDKLNAEVQLELMAIIAKSPQGQGNIPEERRKS